LFPESATLILQLWIFWEEEGGAETRRIAMASLEEWTSEDPQVFEKRVAT